MSDWFKRGVLFTLVMVVGMLVGTPAMAEDKPLKIGYSDWPGWVAWEIAIQKGWFKEEGVDVEFKWFDYVPSMDAYVAGNVDAVTMTNGDALVTGATGYVGGRLLPLLERRGSPTRKPAEVAEEIQGKTAVQNAALVLAGG